MWRWCPEFGALKEDSVKLLVMPLGHVAECPLILDWDLNRSPEKSEGKLEEIRGRQEKSQMETSEVGLRGSEKQNRLKTGEDKIE